MAGYFDQRPVSLFGEPVPGVELCGVEQALLLRRLGMLDNYFGLVTVYVAYSLSFSIFVLTAFFKTLPGELAELLVDGIGLGDGHDDPGHPHQADDLKVLAGLRHHALVGRHHQERPIDAGRAGNHGVDQPLMPGDVHEVQLEVILAQLGEAEVDGDPPFPFLREPVTVGAGECLDQGGLAVIDVTGGAEDDVTHDGMVRAPAAAA